MEFVAIMRGAMIAAPVLLLRFRCYTERMSPCAWDTAADEWVLYVASIQDRWLALHVAGLDLFPLLEPVVMWMLPPGAAASR